MSVGVGVEDLLLEGIWWCLGQWKVLDDRPAVKNEVDGDWNDEVVMIDFDGGLVRITIYSPENELCDPQGNRHLADFTEYKTELS